MCMFAQVSMSLSFFFLTFFMSHSRIMTSSMRQMRVTSADLVLDP